ncbi:MAG: FAD:protein FMN transferase, partial [Thermoplasmata archaeon]|nr:FAD:protein FMN transferase [Thermoplasmata archaeon]
MNDKMVLAGLAGLLVVLLVTGSFFWEEPGEKELQRFEETRDLMDTYVTIIVYAENRGTAETAMDAAYESMEETIAIANRFDPSSEISRLNTNGTLENASSELVEM